jgi:hypothetical protein
MAKRSPGSSGKVRTVRPGYPSSIRYVRYGIYTGILEYHFAKSGIGTTGTYIHTGTGIPYGTVYHIPVNGTCSGR